jgi:hypothetical protein
VVMRERSKPSADCRSELGVASYSRPEYISRRSYRQRCRAPARCGADSPGREACERERGPDCSAPPVLCPENYGARYRVYRPRPAPTEQLRLPTQLVRQPTGGEARGSCPRKGSVPAVTARATAGRLRTKTRHGTYSLRLGRHTGGSASWALDKRSSWGYALSVGPIAWRALRGLAGLAEAEIHTRQPSSTGLNLQHSLDRHQPISMYPRGNSLTAERTAVHM